MRKVFGICLVIVLLVISIVITFLPTVYAREKSAYPIIYATCASSGNYGGSTTSYLLLGPPHCSPSSAPNSGAPFGVIVPSPGTLSNLHAAYGGGGFGYNATFTVYVNGLSTSLACTASNGGNGLCSDNSDDANVAEGDVVNVEVTTSSSVNSGPSMSVSFEKQ